MSWAEEILDSSLRKVLHEADYVSLKRNYRPDFLKNYWTGRNLELDFFLPYPGLGIEVQGPHHYESGQRERDKIKEKLMLERGLTLLSIGLFKVSPIGIYSKFMKLREKSGLPICTRRFDPSWTKDLEFSRFKQEMLRLHGPLGDHRVLDCRRMPSQNLRILQEDVPFYVLLPGGKKDYLVKV